MCEKFTFGSTIGFNLISSFLITVVAFVVGDVSAEGATLDLSVGRDDDELELSMSS